MGRKRTTGCTARHFPDEPCRACQALRARRSRDRASRRRAREEAAAKAAAETERKREAAAAASGKPIANAAAVAAAPLLEPSDPEREALDKAAAEHRAQLIRAKMYVAAYRRRGSIIPPDACERCGLGERLTRWSRPTPLVAWHPDPSKPKEVAWLCAGCRRHVRAVREPLTLSWVWPGGVPARLRGRPVVVEMDPVRRAAAVAAASAVAPRTSFAGLASDLFLHTFLAAAGPDVETLYCQGARAGERWTPLGNPAWDAALREWVKRERTERARGERVAEPAPAWERRPRRDRLPLLPPSPDEGERRPAVFDEGAQAGRMAAAMERLAEAETKADEALERVQRALESMRAPRSTH
jgi:hypothetical protein